MGANLTRTSPAGLIMSNKDDGCSSNSKDSEGISMESVNRVSKLPVVETTVNLASDIYSKVKGSNEIVSNVLTKAEDTAKQAVDMTKPLTTKLEGSIKKVDSLLCTGLDFVEKTIPAIKLPPQEIYDNTKNMVKSSVEPAIKRVQDLSEQGYQKVTSTFAHAENNNNPNQSTNNPPESASKTNQSCNK